MLCDAFCSHTALPRARGMHQPRDSAVFSLKTNNNSNSDEQNGLITLDYVSLKGSKQTEKRKQATRSKWLLRQEAVWCRDSTGWFLPVMSQKKTPHVATVFWFNDLSGICGSLAVLAGPEASLAVWVFLRVA